ncbi:hypothetical protein IQ37_04445 [Chryseobacterium piperi]|uniref:DUF1684 domain-containing protein n=1 Tax=Chryseobacterium piperi TaxID=558152 RepID=A0A086BL55_9FLAO|nr:DUF1684 domain-containing protein [Chryseobacterium piperi]ASW74627.1 DUF1684 domain-containing protein [Chryseobacterium piperi]KFF29669.1 hypothetical protein IQ37_04445 [Chryseobacterium piperi]
MKKYIVVFFLLPLLVFSQKTMSKEEREVKKFQDELNAEYLNPKESPLRGDNLTNFKEHPFFPIDMKYRVNAKLIRTENAQPFEIPTSSGKTKLYKEYGKASFELDGKPYTLTLYQSLDLLKQKKYQDYLFLPFRDATNEKETYGGGKYMDLKIPKGNTIILDFNQSYHPYCAYNAYDYNCPIVPDENKLPIEIRAGVMYNDIYHH